MEKNFELLEEARLTIMTRMDLQTKKHTTKEIIEDIQKKFDKMIQELKKNNFNMKDLTLDEAKSVGFKLWDNNKDREGKLLYLIPFWMYDLIPIGMEVESIFNEKIVNDGTNLDNDHRMGCLAYGIRL